MMIIALALAAAACKDKVMTWTAVEDSAFGTTNIRAIAYGNNRFVVGGENGKIAYSKDGVTWTAVADNVIWEYPTNGEGDKTANINAITYGGGKWVAGGNNGKMAYSDDGVTWTAVADSTFGDNSVFAIACGNNKWVAVGDDCKMAYSDDGISWTAVSNNPFLDKYDPLFSYFNYIGDIAYGNNKWVAGGNDGKMAYSDDGETWTAVADSAFDSGIWAETITAIAYGSDGNAVNRFVAGGNNGKIAYSDDGETWTAVANSTVWGDYQSEVFGTLPAYICAIAYGNNRFVAVGINGKTAYSANGITWPPVPDSAIGNNTIIAIAYGNKRFVAVGENGKIAYADW